MYAVFLLNLYKVRHTSIKNKNVQGTGNSILKNYAEKPRLKSRWVFQRQTINSA